MVGNAVKTMPDNLLNTVDGVMEGFSRVFQKPSRNDEEEETMKVSSEIDVEVCTIITTQHHPRTYSSHLYLPTER